MSEFSFQKELLQAIRDPAYHWASHFDEWATRLFDYQFANNQPYRKFCENQGVHKVQHHGQIPPVPTDAFKSVDLSTQPDSVSHTFLTSGTTHTGRGRHHFVTLDYYRAAIPQPFRTHCLPQGRMPLCALVASPGEMPESSLSFMTGELMKEFGHPLFSGFYLNEEEDGQFDFDFDGFVDFLDQASSPVFILGTAFAFVEFFDLVDRTWSLPKGSRLLETGGLKGKTRQVPKSELYQNFEERFGIAPTHCLGEYSMTELSSQAYSDNFAKQKHYVDAAFCVPGWVRVDVVDPMSLEIIEEPGSEGLIRWTDLANVDSVIAIQTADIGSLTEDGFILHGRASGADLRGCSLTVEEIISASKS